jgi:hypothetical protein
MLLLVVAVSVVVGCVAMSGRAGAAAAMHPAPARAAISADDDHGCANGLARALLGTYSGAVWIRDGEDMVLRDRSGQTRVRCATTSQPESLGPPFSVWEETPGVLLPPSIARPDAGCYSWQPSCVQGFDHCMAPDPYCPDITIYCSQLTGCPAAIMQSPYYLTNPYAFAPYNTIYYPQPNTLGTPAPGGTMPSNDIYYPQPNVLAPAAPDAVSSGNIYAPQPNVLAPASSGGTVSSGNIYAPQPNVLAPPSSGGTVPSDNIYSPQPNVLAPSSSDSGSAVTPSVPETPSAPEVESVPAQPEAPAQPEMPSVPDVPSVPSVPSQDSSQQSTSQGTMVQPVDPGLGSSSSSGSSSGSSSDSGLSSGTSGSLPQVGSLTSGQ